MSAIIAKGIISGSKKSVRTPQIIANKIIVEDLILEVAELSVSFSSLKPKASENKSPVKALLFTDETSVPLASISGIATIQEQTPTYIASILGAGKDEINDFTK